VSDDKRDFSELVELVRQNAPAGKPLRVTIRRLSDGKGTPSETLRHLDWDDDDGAMLDTIQDVIEANGKGGRFEVRIRGKGEGAFDESATEYREGRPREENPVAAVADPKGGLEAMIARAMQKKVLAGLQAALEPDDDDEDEEDDVDDEDEDGEGDDEDEPEEGGLAGAVTTIQKQLKEEQVAKIVERGTQSVGGLIDAFSNFLNAHALKLTGQVPAAGPSEASKERPVGVLQAQGLRAVK